MIIAMAIESEERKRLNFFSRMVMLLKACQERKKQNLFSDVIVQTFEGMPRFVKCYE